jgi:thiamine transport system ATP-binding protein
MLRLENLTLALGSFRLQADLGIEAGQRVALIGPSGGGKSTLINAIAGFVTPAAGRILWQGADLGPLPPGRRPLTVLFQDQNLFPHLSVLQNVALGLAPRLRPRPADAKRAEAALASVGLEGFGDRKPAALSGGQQSRVALARALLRQRPILMLDEPFSALGPALKAEMLDLVADILDSSGASLLMVTHDPADARRLTPWTILIAEGRALPPQPTEALFAAPPPLLADYLGPRL